MPPSATVKCTEVSVPRVFPDVLAMAPGTVTVSVEVGTKGAVATNTKVVGVSSCQDPATAGVRVGWGDDGLRGVENCNEIEASLGIPVALSVGLVATRVSGWLRSTAGVPLA